MELLAPVTADCLPERLHTARRTNRRVSIERRAFLRCHGPGASIMASLGVSVVDIVVFHTLIFVNARSERMISQQGVGCSVRECAITEAYTSNTLQLF